MHNEGNQPDTHGTIREPVRQGHRQGSVFSGVSELFGYFSSLK
jgi:hypothetical protein